MNRLLDWAERREWNNVQVWLLFACYMSSNAERWLWLKWPSTVLNVVVGAIGLGVLVRSPRSGKRRKAPA